MADRVEDVLECELDGTRLPWGRDKECLRQGRSSQDGICLAGKGAAWLQETSAKESPLAALSLAAASFVGARSYSRAYEKTNA